MRRLVLFGSLASLSMALLPACAGSREVRALRRGETEPLLVKPDEVNTRAARQEKYFWKEKRAAIPTDMRHDVIIDEATLTAAGAETCFAVVLRTFVKFDEPFSQLGLRCNSADLSVPAKVLSEETSVLAYTYSGTVEKVNVAAPNGSVSVTAPGELQRQVVVREASLCCPVPTGSGITLSITNPRLRDTLELELAMQL